MPPAPQTMVEQLEATAELPTGSKERFNGYGVMGLPFQSGHVLAMRRFAASSVGPGYTSVWHRTPDCEWAFYSDVAPRYSCVRYFGAVARKTIDTEITLEWLTPFRLHIAMPSLSFEWDIDAGTTQATRFMNTAARLLPNAAWRSTAVLAAMGKVAGPLLGAGRVGLHGVVPNGQHFMANPRVSWAIVNSRARLAGEDFGSPGPLQPQARLGDFWIPQHGMLAIGQAYFDPFNPERHSSETSGSSSRTG